VGLSIPDILSVLGGKPMKGKIRTQQCCPVCKGKFQHIPRLGYVCQPHKTIPTKFYLDLWHNGINYKIFSDKLGQPISAYDRAFYLLERINEEISAHKFDPSHWIQGEVKKFYLSELVQTFLEFKLPKIAPSHQRLYRILAERISDYFPVVDIRDLRRLDIENYKSHLEKGGMKGKTLKNYMDQFRAFLNWARAMEMIPTIPSFPETKIIPAKTTWITQEEQITLYALAPEEDKPIFAFLMLHGCRPGEARALRVQDVNLATKTVSISSTWSGQELRERRKSEAPPVLIPIHEECLDYISQRVKTALPGAFLFTNPRSGNHYTDSALDRAWKRILKRAKISGLRKYDACRHSFATNLASSDTPLQTIKNLLGHTSIRTTERYTHADISRMRADLKKLTLKKVVRIKTGSEPEVDEFYLQKAK
jgi:integrase